MSSVDESGSVVSLTETPAAAPIQYVFFVGGDPALEVDWAFSAAASHVSNVRRQHIDEIVSRNEAIQQLTESKNELNDMRYSKEGMPSVVHQNAKVLMDLPGGHFTQADLEAWARGESHGGDARVREAAQFFLDRPYILNFVDGLNRGGVMETVLISKPTGEAGAPNDEWEEQRESRTLNRGESADSLFSDNDFKYLIENNADLQAKIGVKVDELQGKIEQLQSFNQMSMVHLNQSTYELNEFTMMRSKTHGNGNNTTEKLIRNW